MRALRRWWRRMFPPSDACPYLKCRAPMRFAEQVTDSGTLIDVYRCAGTDGHTWHELATEEREDDERPVVA